MRVVKAAAVQLSPVLYSREGMVEKVVRTTQELGHQQVGFATFPETVVPYYPIFLSSSLPCRTSSDQSIGSCSIRR
jgi:nitrilase